MCGGGLFFRLLPARWGSQGSQPRLCCTQGAFQPTPCREQQRQRVTFSGTLFAFAHVPHRHLFQLPYPVLRWPISVMLRLASGRALLFFDKKHKLKIGIRSEQLFLPCPVWNRIERSMGILKSTFSRHEELFVLGQIWNCLRGITTFPFHCKEE